MKYPQLVSSTTPASLQDWLEEELENRGIDSVYTRYILSLLQQDGSDFPECEHQLTKLQTKTPAQMNTKEESVPYSGKSKHKRWKSWEREKLHKLTSCTCSSVFALDSEETRKSAVVECLKSASDGEIGIEMLVDELCLKLKTAKSNVDFDSSESKAKKDGIKDYNLKDVDHNLESPPSSPYEQAKKYYAAFPALSGKSEPMTKLCHQQERGYTMNSVWDGKKLINQVISKHNRRSTSPSSKQQQSPSPPTGTWESKGTWDRSNKYLSTIHLKKESTGHDVTESVAISVIEKAGSWLKDVYEDNSDPSLMLPNVGLQGHQINMKARYSPFGMLWSHYLSLSSSALFRSQSPTYYEYNQSKTSSVGSLHIVSDDDKAGTSSPPNRGASQGSIKHRNSEEDHSASVHHLIDDESESSQNKDEGTITTTVLGSLDKPSCQDDDLDEELLAKLCSKFDNLAAIWNKESDDIMEVSQSGQLGISHGVALHLLPLKETIPECRGAPPRVWAGQLPETEVVISQRRPVRSPYPEGKECSKIFSAVDGISIFEDDGFAEIPLDSFQESPTTDTCTSDHENLLFGEVLEVKGWNELEDFENSESDSPTSRFPEVQRSSIDSTDSSLSSPVENSDLKEVATAIGEDYMLWDQRLPRLHHLQKMWSPTTTTSENTASISGNYSTLTDKECTYTQSYPRVPSQWDTTGLCKKGNCTLTYHRGESRFVEVIPHARKETDEKNARKPESTFSGKSLSPLTSHSSPISERSSTDEENLLTSHKTHFQPIRQESVDTDTSEDAEIVSLTFGESKTEALKSTIAADGTGSASAFDEMGMYTSQELTLGRKGGAGCSTVAQRSCKDKTLDLSPRWCTGKQSGMCVRAASSSLDELASLVGPFSFDGVTDDENGQGYGKQDSRNSNEDLRLLLSTSAAASWKLDLYEDKGVNTDFPPSSVGESFEESLITCWSVTDKDSCSPTEPTIQSLLCSKEDDDKWLNVTDDSDTAKNFISPGLQWKWGTIGDHKPVKWSTDVSSSYPSKDISPNITVADAPDVNEYNKKNLRALRKEIKEEEDELFKDLSCLEHTLINADNPLTSSIAADLLNNGCGSFFETMDHMLGSVNKRNSANLLEQPLLYADQEGYKWQDQNEDFLTSFSRFSPVESIDEERLIPSVPSLPSEKVFYSRDLEEEWRMNSQIFRVRVPKRQSLKPKIPSQKRPCSFYLEGNCRRSDCKFSHDLASITCRFWEEGSCFKGITCPFLHGYGSDSDESAPESHSAECTFALESESDFPSLAKSATWDLSAKTSKTPVQASQGSRSKKKKVAKNVDSNSNSAKSDNKN